MRRSSGPGLVEASPCCATLRGEAFHLLLANDSPLRFVNGLAALDEGLLLEWVKSPPVGTLLSGYGRIRGSRISGRKNGEQDAVDMKIGIR